MIYSGLGTPATGWQAFSYLNDLPPDRVRHVLAPLIGDRLTIQM
jgi:hypothetical protein